MKKLKIFEDSEVKTVGGLLYEKFDMYDDIRCLVYDYLSYYDGVIIGDDTPLSGDITEEYISKVFDEVEKAYVWTYKNYDDLVYIISSGRYVKRILEIDPSIEKLEITKFFIENFVDIITHVHDGGYETKDIFTSVYRKYPDLGVDDVCREIIQKFYKTR